MGFFHNPTMQKKEYSTSKSTSTAIYINHDYKLYNELVANKKLAVISSQNLIKSYPEISNEKNLIVIDDTERNKNLKSVEKIIEQLLELGIDRSSYIIGIGGGIVCDITGFVAHIFMRGVRFGLIPTTLLAMSDAAIGGKNGVNFRESKNMIGSFDNPDFIIADSKFVQTLPESQYMSGLGEIIKYALIGNEKIFSLLKNNTREILNRDSTLLDEIIRDAIITKTEIVEKDPDDKSIRHILNFGHTIGHSIEIIENIPHGMAVVKGIVAATEISVKMQMLDNNIAEQIKQLIASFGYDISYRLGEKHLQLLCNDKKKEDSNIRFVLLEDIGRPIIKKMPINEIIKMLI